MIPFPLGWRIGHFAPTPGRDVQRHQAVLVETLHQLADTVAAFVSYLPRRFHIALARFDGEYRLRSLHHIQSLAGGFGDLLQGPLFGWGHGSQRMCWPHTHNPPPRSYSCPLLMAS